MPGTKRIAKNISCEIARRRPIAQRGILAWYHICTPSTNLATKGLPGCVAYLPTRYLQERSCPQTLHERGISAVPDVVVNKVLSHSIPIERHQSPVVDKVLRDVNLWRVTSACGGGGLRGRVIPQGGGGLIAWFRSS